MQPMQIILEVKQPTDWCVPMVPVAKKNGKVRICVESYIDNVLVYSRDQETHDKNLEVILKTILASRLNLNEDMSFQKERTLISLDTSKILKK